MKPEYYGDDRFFICLRLESDDNSTIDAIIECIKSSGQPMVSLEMRDKLDLGAGFFRWEFATAVAGAVLGIHPFDQPNVKEAKDTTEHILQEYINSGHLPALKATNAPVKLPAQADKGDYLAIMAYIHQTPEVDRVLADFRRKVVERHHIATTLGYGPRFLHSTGQLPKGGPNTGLFLQITADHETDLLIPGKLYTFGVVADAQAIGDFQTLQSSERRIIRVHFSRGDKNNISRLVSELG